MENPYKKPLVRDSVVFHLNTKTMEKPYKIIDNVRHFNYKQTIYYLYAYGRKKYGKNFRIHKEDLPVIRKLIYYIIQEEEKCKEHNIDLKKGILLTGPIGCGKTSWMNLIQILGFEDKHFQVKSTRDIAFEFNRDGYQTINTYGKAHRPFCLDDLGVEQNIKFFGNECNTIAEVLLHRYNLMTNHGMITHATTNLKASELEELYGNRVRSRLRSMFNLISFPVEAKDKRK